MNKYVNGKLVEITEEDKIAIKARFDKMRSHQKGKSTSDYEGRIKELENMVTELLNKSAGSDESAESAEIVESVEATDSEE